MGYKLNYNFILKLYSFDYYRRDPLIFVIKNFELNSISNSICCQSSHFNEVYFKFVVKIVNYFFLSFFVLFYWTANVYLQFVYLQFVYLQFVYLQFVYLQFVYLQFVFLKLIKLHFLTLHFANQYKASTNTFHSICSTV